MKYEGRGRWFSIDSNSHGLGIFWKWINKVGAFSLSVSGQKVRDMLQSAF